MSWRPENGFANRPPSPGMCLGPDYTKREEGGPSWGQPVFPLSGADGVSRSGQGRGSGLYLSGREGDWQRPTPLPPPAGANGLSRSRRHLGCD